jgi:hypothetical protein
MIRDARWKLIEYDAAGVRHTQLFDLVGDSGELHNLADRAGFAAERKHLETLLTKARKDFDDPVAFGNEAAKK